MKNRKEMVSEYKERTIVGGIYAIRNNLNNKTLLLSATDLHGCKNRFEFCQKLNNCTYIKLQQDWQKHGNSIFAFEILDQLEKKENQTEKQFKEEIKILYEIWKEKYEKMQIQLY
ncbi:MAG: GIY-YIG nuclease family protein [Peptostreptococcales bacterium]